MFFPSKTSETETFDIVERRYTLGRRIAIVIWLLVLLALVSVTFLCFASFDAGSEWFVDITIRLVPNFQFEHPHPYHAFIPLIDWGRYVLFALSVIVGLKSLLALFIPPAVRVHPVRVTMTPTGEPIKA